MDDNLEYEEFSDDDLLSDTTKEETNPKIPVMISNISKSSEANEQVDLSKISHFSTNSDAEKQFLNEMRQDGESKTNMSFLSKKNQVIVETKKTEKNTGNENNSKTYQDGSDVIEEVMEPEVILENEEFEKDESDFDEKDLVVQNSVLTDDENEDEDEKFLSQMEKLISHQPRSIKSSKPPTPKPSKMSKQPLPQTKEPSITSKSPKRTTIEKNESHPQSVTEINNIQTSNVNEIPSNSVRFNHLEKFVDELSTTSSDHDMQEIFDSEDEMKFNLTRELNDLKHLKDDLFEYNQKQDAQVNDLNAWERDEKVRILMEENKRIKKRNVNLYNSYNNELLLKKQHVELIKQLKRENGDLRQEIIVSQSRETRLKNENLKYKKIFDNYSRDVEMDNEMGKKSKRDMAAEYEKLLKVKKGQQMELLKQIKTLKSINEKCSKKLKRKNFQIQNFITEHKNIIENYKNLINVLNEKSLLKIKKLTKKLKLQSINELRQKVQSERLLQERLLQKTKNIKYKKKFFEQKNMTNKIKRKFSYFVVKYNDLLGRYNEFVNEKKKTIEKKIMVQNEMEEMENNLLKNRKKLENSRKKINKVIKENSKHLNNNDINNNNDNMRTPKGSKNRSDFIFESAGKDRNISFNKSNDEIEKENIHGDVDIDEEEENVIRQMKLIEKRKRKQLNNFGLEIRDGNRKEKRKSKGNSMRKKRGRKVKELNEREEIERFKKDHERRVKKRKKDGSKKNDDFIMISKLIPNPNAKNYKIRKKNTYFRVVSTKTNK